MFYNINFTEFYWIRLCVTWDKKYSDRLPLKKPLQMQVLPNLKNKLQINTPVEHAFATLKSTGRDTPFGPA